MNKLIAFGDSFTWGTDLLDDIGYGNYNRSEYLEFKKQFPNSTEDRTLLGYSKCTWPSLLSKHLNLSYECLAIPGSSNFSISREFINVLGSITSDDFVVINWTWVDRWDYFDTHDNSWKTLRPSNNKNEVNELYYKYFHSEIWNKFESLKQILLVLNLLKENNINYIMTCVDELINDTQFHNPPYITYIQKQLADDITWFNDMGFYNWSKHNEYAISTHGQHPLEEAHQSAFEYVIKNYEFTK